MLDPAAEWAAIENEPGDPAYVLTRYVAVLAIIPALFGFIGACLVGAVVPGAGLVRAPIVARLVRRGFRLCHGCATVLVLGIVI